MEHLFSARALMGISLGFHIIYVAFGIGFPLLLLVSECLALKTGNELCHRLARGWTLFQGNEAFMDCLCSFRLSQDIFFNR